MQDEDIDFSDIPELQEDFFENATLVVPKKSITLHLDAEVIDWFRSQGKGYQVRMNAILKAYVRRRRGERNSGG